MTHHFNPETEHVEIYEVPNDMMATITSMKKDNFLQGMEKIPEVSYGVLI